jgi:leucyl-tRNA synthetase
LRYTDPKNEREFAAKEKQANWMPVDLYSGGAEHTTMHLLYSRFWHKALFDLQLVNESEPYVHRENHGLVLGTDGQKMSKSKDNVMDPDELVERVGSDTVRIYLGFMGPYTGGLSYPWNPGGVIGVRRFLERVWRAQAFVTPDHDLKVGGDASGIGRVLHRTIKKVGEDIDALKFNTAISALMIVLNSIEKVGSLSALEWRTFLLLLAPFAPHLTEELWQETGGNGAVHQQPWPTYDPKLLIEETVVVAIQIDGKTRGEVAVPSGSDKETTERMARQAVAVRLEGKTIARTIVVPGRLINFVTS